MIINLCLMLVSVLQGSLSNGLEEIVAVYFPIVYSKTGYMLVSDYEQSKNPYQFFYCNGRPYKVDPLGGFAFRAPPSHRNLCFAQIYIEPTS